jgi:hypothetical protein
MPEGDAQVDNRSWQAEVKMQAISAAVPGAIAELLRSGPLTRGKVEFAWNAAVGPALQRVTAVRLEDGVLIVDAAGAQWAREVSRSIGIILPRLQRLLGAEHVNTITVRMRA